MDTDSAFGHSRASFSLQQTQQSYYQLSERLKFPSNPAYLKARPKKHGEQQVLDFCREQNIPFNETDRLLYKV
jgi:hypothetical protein